MAMKQVCDIQNCGPINGTNTTDEEQMCKKCLVKVNYFTGATK